MTTSNETLWERFLKPIFKVLIDENKLRELEEKIDWTKVEEIFSQPDLVYPAYYKSQNFHGINGGYLTKGAALTYDAVTQYVLPPHEMWVREGLINQVKGYPLTILDLGCGTGSTTILLKQKFPQAEVTGLDLSPYMLAMAKHKATEAGLKIRWHQGLAENTTFGPASFDLVTMSLLFHETPPHISKQILRESFRLLKDSGQVLMLDGNQKTLRNSQWLTDVFEEPYIKDYANQNVDAWLGAAGFDQINTFDLFFVHQLSTGFKAIADYSTSANDEYDDNSEDLTTAQPAF